MLDSLVRVSRRVAAYADLLGREWATATVALLAVQVAHMPVGSEVRTPAHDTEAPTECRALDPVPTVPTVTPSGDAPRSQDNTPTAGHC